MNSTFADLVGAPHIKSNVSKTIDSIISDINRDTSFLNKPNSEIKIAVAMSGGVDSSVCPIFFQEAGYNVQGITLKLYENKHEKQGACCSFRDIFDAKRVAEQFNFPHYVINYEKQFKKEVIDKFISDYISGRTPIPCVQCNQVIKFNYMFELIKGLEFDFLVTGHYILRKEIVQGKPELFIANDRSKDQSYFLYNITGKRLKNLLFPLGSLQKHETREIAEHFAIKTSKKPESQDICFVEDGSYRKFIQDAKEDSDFSLSTLIGDFILNETGENLGKHTGIQNYTIGQRKGIGISHSKPLYVIKIDEKTKEVFLGGKDELICTHVRFSETSWIYEKDIMEKLEKEKQISVQVRLRSMHKNLNALLSYDSSNKNFIAELLSPQYLVCPGQACVVYDGEKLLGGGTIL